MVNVGVWCVATFLPSLLLLWYFIRSDRFPEPTGVLVKTFLLGLLITIPVIIAEGLVQSAFADVGGQITQALVPHFLWPDSARKASSLGVT